MIGKEESLLESEKTKGFLWKIWNDSLMWKKMPLVEKENWQFWSDSTSYYWQLWSFSIQTGEVLKIKFPYNFNFVVKRENR